MCMGWPEGLTWYRLFTDWGSFIGGLLALLAGILAYIGAYQAASIQLKAADRKDRAKARGIVVAISPELLKLDVDLGRIDQVLTAWLAYQPGKGYDLERLILDAKIELPPMIERNIDHFYLIEDGGADLVQLVSVLLQYNGLVERLGRGRNASTQPFDAAASKKNLEGHLKIIRTQLDTAADKIKDVHVEAVTPP